MTITDKEYRDLLSFFAIESSANNIISLSLTEEENEIAGAETVSSTTTTFNLNAENAASSNRSTNDSVKSFLDLSSIDFADIFAISSTAATTLLSNEDAINSTITTSEFVEGNQSGPIIPRISSETPIWLIPCYSIILLFAIVGNALVISTLVQNRRMRTITNLFLLNLAISDILLGVLCMPVTLVGTLLRHFIFGEFLCKLIQFSQGQLLNPRLAFAGHSHRYCRSRNRLDIEEYTVASFNWRNNINPSFLLATFSAEKYAVHKCDMLPQDKVYNVYTLALIITVIWLAIWLTRMKREKTKSQ